MYNHLYCIIFKYKHTQNKTKTHTQMNKNRKVIMQSAQVKAYVCGSSFVFKDDDVFECDYEWAIFTMYNVSFSTFFFLFFVMCVLFCTAHMCAILRVFVKRFCFAMFLRCVFVCFRFVFFWCVFVEKL